MKIDIKRIKIKENKSNEVTSSKLFPPRKNKDANGNYYFNPEGIFSDRIFGRFGKCRCGNQTKPGYCKSCDCRVLSINKIPDFYIKFDHIRIPYLDNDYSQFGEMADYVKDIMDYKAFVYRGAIIQNDLEKINASSYNDDEVLTELDAIKELGISEEWYYENTTSKINIPHTTYRPMIKTDKKVVLTPINDLFINILKEKEDYAYYSQYSKGKIAQLSIKRGLLAYIEQIQDQIFEMLAKTRNSVINKEVRGQAITGAARAVITNNFDINEDIALIGSYFVDVLYPVMSNKYRVTLEELSGVEVDETNYDEVLEEYGKEINENGYKLGEVDIVKVNNELEELNYRILINRAPTIGEKSILGMIPRFSLEEKDRYVLQINPIVTDGLAGDFDGDVILMLALYSNEAMEEADKLIPSKNFLGGENSKVRNGLPKDFVYVMKRAYQEGNEVMDKIKEIIYG